MTMVRTSKAHITQLASWFNTPDECASWSGSTVRYPFTQSSLFDDLNNQNWASFVLLNENSELIGFGQFYSRIGRCHLARLVVSPQHRGQGVAAKLIDNLLEIGLTQLAVNEASLFVLADNHRALKVYQKNGFECTDYPEPLNINNCLYLVKKC